MHKEIALFGGSFDPIHIGHVGLLQEIHRTLQIDKIILIPCKQSPHKLNSPGATSQERLEMCRIATQDLPFVEISSLEVDRSEASFSWMTVKHFQEQRPQYKLHWILGTDQWDNLDRWAKYSYLKDTMHFIVVQRQSEITHYTDRAYTELQFNLEISSTKIRTQLAEKETPESLHEEVLNYIHTRRLYQS